MALPPTAIKFSTDVNNVTTFFFNFPNFTGSHSGVTATLGINSVAGGGTGLASLTAHSLLAGAGTSNVSLIAPSSTAGFALLSNGSSADPSFQNLSATYLPLAGGTMSGSINFGGFQALNAADPISPQALATKNYVDNIAAGINPAVAVQAATTSASNTSSFTYNNGVGGIGATLTGPNNTALVVDGFTFNTLGQRLLVKNDTQSPSGAFNGIYYVTQLQALALGVVLTRALDYDQPSDMNNTGAIPVINGTVNGTTQWVLSSLVNTVGTDPLTFTQFARNPADYLLKANNLSDVSSKSSSFDNLSPMTTGGDIIYGGASGTGTRLANGSAGQVLTSNGGTAAPSWQNISNSSLSYAQAYMPTTTSWSTSSASFVDPTNSGSNTLTSVTSSGITLTAGASNIPGITFTPASSNAVYFITAQFGVVSTGTNNGAGIKLTDGTFVIASNGTYSSPSSGTGSSPFTIGGIYVPGTSSPVTVKLSVLANGGTVTLENNGSQAAGTFGLTWTVIRIV